MRRPVAVIVAAVLFAEALGVAALNWLLGTVVDRQDMSLAGLDSDMMSTSSKIGGIVFGLYFALCGLVALLVAVRGRQPAGLGRILLISAAVVHGLLGAFVWGLVGRSAFLFMMIVLALIVLLLMTYDRQGGAGDAEPRDAGPQDQDGGPEGGDPQGEAPQAGPSRGEAPGSEGPEGVGPAPVTPPVAPTTP